MQALEASGPWMMWKPRNLKRDNNMLDGMVDTIEILIDNLKSFPGSVLTVMIQRREGYFFYMKETTPKLTLV
jgi:hypothetical protein